MGSAAGRLAPPVASRSEIEVIVETLAMCRLIKVVALRPRSGEYKEPEIVVLGTPQADGKSPLSR
jgi:hypothetical protein